MFIERPCQKYLRVTVAKIVTEVRVAIYTEERRSPWQPIHGPPPGTCQVKCSVCNELKKNASWIRERGIMGGKQS